MANDTNNVAQKRRGYLGIVPGKINAPGEKVLAKAGLVLSRNGFVFEVPSVGSVGWINTDSYKHGSFKIGGRTGIGMKGKRFARTMTMGLLMLGFGKTDTGKTTMQMSMSAFGTVTNAVSYVVDEVRSFSWFKSETKLSAAETAKAEIVSDYFKREHNAVVSVNEAHNKFNDVKSLSELEAEAEKLAPKLSTKEILEIRKKDTAYYNPARRMALEELKRELKKNWSDDYTFHLKEVGKSWITDTVGMRDIHPGTGERNVAHNGTDMHYRSGPVYSGDTLIFGATSRQSKPVRNTATYFKTNGNMLVYRHSFADKNYHKGDTILPYEAPVVTIGPKEKGSTHKHLHVEEYERDENGEWQLIDSRETAENMMKVFKKVKVPKELDTYLSARIRQGDLVTFDRIDDMIDDDFVESKNGVDETKRAKLHAQYAKYTKKLDKAANKFLEQGLKDDRKRIAMFFKDIAAEQADVDVVKEAKSSPVTAKTIKNTKKIDVEEKVIGKSDGKGGRFYIDDNNVVHWKVVPPSLLRERMLKNERLQELAKDEGVDIELIVSKAFSLSTERENPERKPDVVSETSTARGHFQFTKVTIAGCRKIDPTLKRYPKGAAAETVEGIDTQIDYFAVNYRSKIDKARAYDASFRKKHNGVPLYETVMIPDDHHQTISKRLSSDPLYVSYLDMGVAFWAGDGHINPKMVKAKEKAIKDGVPYAIVNLAVKAKKQKIQHFTNYLDAGQSKSMEYAHQRVAAERLENNPLLNGYYASNRKSVIETVKSSKKHDKKQRHEAPQIAVVEEAVAIEEVTKPMVGRALETYHSNATSTTVPAYTIADSSVTPRRSAIKIAPPVMSLQQ